jgi:inorganic pyrophosphatase
MSMHPWNDIYVDDHLIAKAFPVVIEVPMGSKNKYEFDSCCRCASCLMVRAPARSSRPASR